MLGPLEARLESGPLSVSGGKQRAVLAALLLHVDEVVSKATLIEEVWGDDPPPTATHSLEVYISRLRRLFVGLDLQFVRRGAGYAALLEGAALDARQFELLADEAQRAAAEEGHEVAASASAAALALWRGPVLADVGLGPAGRSEATRLEELRLCTLEIRFDADLALGRHDSTVGELRATVARHPYRERFVGQLMLALYRCGRHADALAVYEHMRRRLDDDLGLQPSVELRQLSARIVRQEPELRASTPTTRPVEGQPVERRARRIVGLVLVGVAATAAMALTASGSAPPHVRPLDAGSGRIALVLPAQPAESAFEESLANSRMTWTAEGFEGAAANYGLEAETLSVDEVAPGAADIDRLVRRIEDGRYDLVLLQGDRASARLMASRVGEHPETRFVFLDTSLAELSLEGVPNAAAVRFVIEHSARLSGAASGLASARGAVGRGGARVISVVAGIPDLETRRVIAGFRQGVRAALPGARVRVDYTGETYDVTPCERLANEQIDAGAEIVFVVAGRCGLGAAAVARARRIWVAGEDEYGMSDQEPWVVASMFKDWKQAPQAAIEAFVAGALPAGGDLELGVDDNYATGMTMSSALPAAIQSEVVDLCSRIRRHAEETDAESRTAALRA